MDVVAIFGPTGVGKTGVAIELAELLRERGEDPVAISCDALQVYEGLSVLTGVATAEEQARLEHRLVGFVPITRPFSVGDYMPLGSCGDRCGAGGGAAADRGGGDWAVSAGGAGGAVVGQGAAGIRGLGALVTRDETPDLDLRARHGPGEALRADRCRTEAIVAAGAREEVARAEEAGPSRTARKALGFDEVLAGDIERMRQRSRNYARRQLTWMRKVPNLRWIDRTARPDTDVATEIANHLR